MEEYFLVKLLIYGYLYGSYICLMKYLAVSPLYKPASMDPPTLSRKIKHALVWPMDTFFQIYFAMLPGKIHATLCGFTAAVLLWIMLSVYVGFLLLPLYWFDNTVFAIAVVLGLFFIMGGVISLAIPDKRKRDD